MNQTINNNNNKKYLSQGYSIKKTLNTNHKNNKKNVTDEAKRYPNGVIPFVCLLLFYVIFTIVVLVLGFTNASIKQFFPWYWSTLSAAIAYFLLNILWAIGRTGFSSVSGYMMMKTARITRMRKIRDKLEYFVNEPAINDVNNMDEYNTYVLERKKYTKKFFYTSLILSGSIFVINLIVSLSFYYSL